MSGRTVRDAIMICFENLPGKAIDWMIEDEKAMKRVVIDYVIEYAISRGVILETKDIRDELVAIIRETKARGE